MSADTENKTAYVELYCRMYHPCLSMHPGALAKCLVRRSGSPCELASIPPAPEMEYVTSLWVLYGELIDTRAGDMMPDLQPQDIERVMHGNEDLMQVSHLVDSKDHFPLDLSR